MASSFCAICTSERGPFVQRPLGKRCALVTVCEECDATHPRSGRYTFESTPAKAQTLNAIQSRNGNRRGSGGMPR